MRACVWSACVRTFGGGRKEFLLTLIKWSTFASSCVFKLRRQNKGVPLLATNRIANSRWNISTAQRKRGR